MRSVYILLTRSRSIASQMIYVFSGAKYTHSSISFHGRMEKMYSFGRRYVHLLLPAGLKEETLDTGFYGAYPRIPCALFEFRITEESYDRALAEILKMMAVQGIYKYSILGLAACKLGIRWKRKNKYFCSEFIAEVLEKSGAMTLPRAPSLIRPIDYAAFPGGRLLYEGTVGELAALLRENEEIAV